MSIAAKAKYVADKGIGGLMIWELADDYKLDTARNQYVMGTTLIDAMNTAIPGGATLEFDYDTSAPGSMSDQSGFGLRVTAKGHSGANAGGLRGDFQHVSVTIPSWQTIPAGGQRGHDHRLPDADRHPVELQADLRRQELRPQHRQPAGQWSRLLGGLLTWQSAGG